MDNINVLLAGAKKHETSLTLSLSLVVCPTMLKFFKIASYVYAEETYKKFAVLGKKNLCL
jgi:hypothetical protein